MGKAQGGGGGFTTNKTSKPSPPGGGLGGGFLVAFDLGEGALSQHVFMFTRIVHTYVEYLHTIRTSFLIGSLGMRQSERTF